MNLTGFIKKVDKAAGNMPAENMAAFLHDYARSIPEGKREDFLARLASFAGKSVDAGVMEKQDQDYEKNLKQEIQKILAQLEEIDSGELMLEEILNEEYDEWYDDTEEFYYEDPEHIGDTIQEGCRLVHACVDSELYEEGLELADFLFTMHIEADGEFGCGDFSLGDLARENIITLDYEKFVMEALLAAYWGSSLKERPGEVYRLLYHSGCKDISLEMLMQQSKKELEQFPEFLSLWTDYLGNLEDREAGRLMLEAVKLADDPKAFLHAARTYARRHPDLYIRVLEQYQEAGNAQSGLEIGREALERIPPDCRIRSRAALLTAEAALRLGEQETAEKCWLEAFRSECSVVNYLRLLLECREYGTYREEAEGIFLRACSGTENRNVYGSLLFFSGQIRRMMAEGMNVSGALGWSSTFMKEGMALLLLYLYEGSELSEGCRAMCRKYVSSAAFRAQDYRKGTLCSEEADDQQFFWECFCRWKQHMAVKENEVQEILQQLDRWVRLRVEGIMEKSHRNYYGECAAFIAALGEVKESHGGRGSKAALMETYRSMYSRRRAFHEELRAFGMRDTRR